MYTHLLRDNLFFYQLFNLVSQLQPTFETAQEQIMIPSKNEILTQTRTHKFAHLIT